MLPASLARGVCALVFIGSGSLHFLWPGAYAAIVPRYLPGATALVALTGAAEIAGGAGLLVPATRRLAAAGLILLLIAVFPANIEMLEQHRERGGAWWKELLLWLRLPLQLALIGLVWAASRDVPASRGPSATFTR